MSNELEKEFLYLSKIFKSASYKRFERPKELNYLADIVNYKRLKNKFKHVDIEEEGKKLVKELHEILVCLERL